MAEYSRTTRRIARVVLEGFAPPPNLAPSEWAERAIYIPVGNAVPGLIRFDNAPYQREPLDMTSDPECHRISLMWGAQVGKTTLALCAQAYRIVQNPQSQIMMQPSQGDLHTWLETKFNPMVEANEELQNRIAKPRSREGVNNQNMKSYPGGFLMFSWSGSPKTMRGRSAPFIVCDETDGYDRTHEGHPVGLLWQRAATFGDQRLLMEISTPTIKGASWIESAFEQGDQRRFHVPCPHCGAKQPLRWAQVVWGKGPDGEHLPASARYLCAAYDCGTLWSDGERVAAIRRGEWVAEKPFRGHASYHLNELYSCFRKLGDIVQSFLDKKAANDLQTFVNVSLAETWEEAGEQLKSSDLIARAERFAAPVPAGGLVLTCGVDMQEDRLELETVAWGLGEESWSVDYTVLWGDPLHGDVWDDLDAHLSRTWLHQSGAQLPISATCLDTGGRGGYTQAAYDYARGKTGRRLFAIKGVEGWGRPIVSAPSKKKSGQRARKVDLFSVGVDEAKLIVARRLAQTALGPGYCHVPDDRDAEWFAMATAEKLVTKHLRGFAVRSWHKTRDRNEALDCRVYAYAALKVINPNLPRLAKRLAADVDDDEPTPAPVETISAPRSRLRASAAAHPPQAGIPPEDQEPPPAQSAAKGARQKRPRRGANWVNRW